jgi:putative ABC transport system substrate-binding protein
VFSSGSDPVAAGWVASFNRPGGNLTGVASLGVQLGPKKLELLNQAVPNVKTIAALTNPANPRGGMSKELEEAARELGLQLEIVNWNRSLRLWSNRRLAR